MNLNERIKKIIEYSELSASEFADEIDVQRSNISHITSGRNKPSLDFIIKIKTRFPELQWDWLISGSGKMVKKNEEELIVEKPKPSSLPDLFSLINDENFGVTESEDKISNDIPRESKIREQSPKKEEISDSQRLDIPQPKLEAQVIENQEGKIKRIVWFYENGKFESFEP
ncbi:helix-turn-helix domain-containing protein [Kaistella jeonii]|uniref:Transcriptional regulator n=1 Tax=Kaistella jeonii TaxID=266749 RepID=A0A0C1D4H4_9FLAO|nr:helix-turn-helix transcriptional regulator [Kaistella jeonii]KIA88640.1 transcriptional regulator [Kaistella jeonii]SFC09004.1 Helix-turn-helix [Kaistella jeonii]VEI95199.1 Helix-turn-helix domain [Kaistella jeonii]